MTPNDFQHHLIPHPHCAGVEWHYVESARKSCETFRMANHSVVAVSKTNARRGEEKVNKLKLNENKTKYMVVSYEKKALSKSKYEIIYLVCFFGRICRKSSIEIGAQLNRVASLCVLFADTVLLWKE